MPATVPGDTPEKISLAVLPASVIPLMNPKLVSNCFPGFHVVEALIPDAPVALLFLLLEAEIGLPGMKGDRNGD